MTPVWFYGAQYYVLYIDLVLMAVDYIFWQIFMLLAMLSHYRAIWTGKANDLVFLILRDHWVKQPNLTKAHRLLIVLKFEPNLFTKQLYCNIGEYGLSLLYLDNCERSMKNG